MSTEPTYLQTLIDELGLQINATLVPLSQSPDKDAKYVNDMQIHWTVRVHRLKHALAADIQTTFSQGIGHLPKHLYSSGCVMTADRDEAIRNALETGVYRFGIKRGPLKRPTITDVLYCLMMDASALDHGTFESWAADYSYDVDSRKAEALYRACLETGLKLRAMLGDANLQRLREAFQDY